MVVSEWWCLGGWLCDERLRFVLVRSIDSCLGG